ncbi:hypothetical protein [Teredinibacter turnerae]|uniref:hypothetical protein n=1 Tax=Teredinibacter turnerae TaxID=2426 RepID=UPI0030D50B2C
MYLIDTNVMLAASAVGALSNVADRAMPHEIELRERVFEWLVNFEESDEKLVLDESGLVRAEYERNLPFNYQEQEYGMLVLQNKLDLNLVEHVPIETLEANGEHIALLEAEHEALVADREDRKWIACALSTSILHEEFPPIVYGAETDWYIAHDALTAIGIAFVRLLPDAWYEDRISNGS